MEKSFKNSNATARRTARLASCALALTFVTAAFAPAASAQTLAYDGFGGAPAADLAGSTGGSGWTSAWSPTGVDVTTIAGAGLSYAGLDATPGGAVTPDASGIWPNSRYQRAFTPAPSGATSLYVSFLLRDDTANSSWGGLTFGQWPNAVTVGAPSGYYEFGIVQSQGLGDFSGQPIVQGETTLVVVRIDRTGSGSGSSYRMYLDPTIGAPEPGFAAATFGIGPVSVLPTALSIDNGTGITTDEIRVGTTWNSVLPAAYDPWTDMGFAKPGVNGAPHLTGVGTLAGGTLTTLKLSNAAPNATAWLAIGTSTLNLPILGGVLVPDPQLIVLRTTTAAGNASFRATWPTGVASGQAVFAQYWVLDAAASFGVSASNGLQGLTP
jgi:hypothetical protein